MGSYQDKTVRPSPFSETHSDWELYTKPLVGGLCESPGTYGHMYGHARLYSKLSIPCGFCIPISPLGDENTTGMFWVRYYLEKFFNGKPFDWFHIMYRKINWETKSC